MLRTPGYLSHMTTNIYASDLSGAEWTILAPPICPGKQAGHPHVFGLCRIVDAVFYLLRTRGQWRALPHDLPPWSACVWRPPGRQPKPATPRLSASPRRPASAIPAACAAPSFAVSVGRRRRCVGPPGSRAQPHNHRHERCGGCRNLVQDSESSASSLIESATNAAARTPESARSRRS